MKYFKRENMSLILNFISIIFVVILYFVNDAITGEYPIYLAFATLVLFIGLFISMIYYLRHSKFKILNILLSFIGLYFGAFNSLIILLVMLQYKNYYTMIFSIF